MFKETKILLVEDEELAQLVAKKQLEEFGCEVDVAATGAEAIRLFEKSPYDMVFMDLGIFDMDGFKVAKKFLSMRHKIAGIPLVALTVHTSSSVKKRAFRLGFKEYINKPLTYDACKRALRLSPRHTSTL
jgi:two-component system, OmpR family, aerobic respiration control sensor histidine kinase ArcB